MMNNKKMKKAVASILACAMTCTLLPASESFAARNNNNNKNEDRPSIVTGGAVSTNKPQTVSHGAIGNRPNANGNVNWDFSDIFSWLTDDGNWDDITWGEIDWENISWDDFVWGDIEWDGIQDMFPVTGGAIGCERPNKKPIASGGAIDAEKPNDTERPNKKPIVSGGAIDAEKPNDTERPNKKPIVTGGAVDSEQPDRENAENQRPENTGEPAATTKPGKDKVDEHQKPATPDNNKENGDAQQPEKDNADTKKQPVATASDGAVTAQVPDANAQNQEQKPEENVVPTDAVSDGAVTATTKKKEKAKIKVRKTSKKVKMGKKYKITYSIVCGSGKVTFKSSNKKVATVNSQGVVIAKKKGKATITVKIANGTSKKVKITVK